MKKYLNQLIEDMHKAAENLPVKPYLEISEDEECLRGVMEYESTKPKPMQEWFGIDKANFPPAEKLSKDELKLMVAEILKLWNAYNFDAVLPENLPYDIAYKVLVDNFGKPVEWISEGTVGIEFCDYDEGNCPFPGYCNLCKNFSKENKTDNKNDFDINQEDILPSKKNKKFILNQKKENIIEEHKINKNNIPGIYNYCDRWCEHCLFTSRCLNYEMSEKYLKGHKNNDLNKDEFWGQINEIFKHTREMIECEAKKRGIDLSNIEPDFEFEKKLKQKTREAKEHELSKASKKYYKMVDKWFEAEKSIFTKKETDLNKNIILGINEKDTMKQGDNIVAAVEVINWYQYQIHVKLIIALSHDDNLFDYKRKNEFPSDADGSAKVALIGIDRSISAWGQLQKHFPEKYNDILDILVLLEKIRRKTEHYFPKARTFVRPGFDE